MEAIEFDEKCKSCGGTGLYVGMAERDGAAVVCNSCKGTGCHHFRHVYENFIKRKSRRGVEWVYEANPGIIIGKGNGKYHLKDFGGLPMEDWIQEGKFPPGTENRRFTCPAWWYQNVDYERKPKWKECIGIGSFSQC